MRCSHDQVGLAELREVVGGSGRMVPGLVAVGWAWDKAQRDP